MILWQKCSEILPSDGSTVLAYMPKSQLKVCVCSYNKTFGFIYGHIANRLRPTHWASFDIPE
jgi:hypothetical protein